MLGEEKKKIISIVNNIYSKIQDLSENEIQVIKKTISVFYETKSFAKFCEEHYNKKNFNLNRYSYLKKQEIKDDFGKYMGFKNYYDWSTKIYPTYALIRCIEKLWSVYNGINLH